MIVYKFSRGLIRAVVKLLYKVEVEGVEHLPEEGGCIVCSNHFNLLDPVVIGTFLPRKINYMAKEELFSNRLFASFLDQLGVFPVKRGAADISAIKTAIRIVKGKGVLGIFPEGTRSKTGEMQEAKPGVAMIAIKSQALVVPAAIISNYKLFNKIKIKIGQPLSMEEHFGNKLSVDDYQSISQDILDEVKKLMN